MFLYINGLVYCFFSLVHKLNEAVKFDPAVCPNGCGRKYRGKNRKSNLKVHMRFECGVPRQFQCQICNRDFVLKAHLRGHMGVVHGVVL